MPKLNGSDFSILDLAKSLVSSQDVDALLIQIGGAVERLTHCEAASILMLDAEKKQLWFRAATGEKGSTMKRFYIPLGQGVAGWVGQHQVPVIINDVGSDLRFMKDVDKNSGFKTKSILAVPMIVGDELLGVCEAINKTDGEFSGEDQKTLEQLASFAGVILQNAKLVDEYRNFFSHAIDIVTTAIEGADSRLTGHSFRVASLACRIGRKMGLEGVDYKNLYYGAILHDLGMIAVHDLRYLPNILSKTVERTPEKLHPLVGAELVKDIKLLTPIGPILRHHHEHVDGSGHPDGLVGDDIPLAARIICLCEHIDELHMNGLAGDEYESEAAKLASEGAGTKFDREVVAAFLSLGTE